MGYYAIGVLRLTAVIPTRNRLSQLRRLLEFIDRQTLSTPDFEVIVVDDGSNPPVDPSALSAKHAFALRILRRDRDHGAHDSRLAGALLARGKRILFLDDDLDLDPQVFAAHAAIPDGFAVGPILCHVDELHHGPYQRRQERFFSEYVRTTLDPTGTLPIEEFYICNASGPTGAFLRLFEAVRDLYASGPVPGAGLDEELLDFELKRSVGGTIAVAHEAKVWHRDRKTLTEACEENRQLGVAHCRFLLERPDLRSVYSLGEPIAARLGWYRAARALTGARGWYPAARLRLFWAFPQAYRAIADVLARVADAAWFRRGPTWVCRPPLAIGYWEGLRSVAPRYSQLRASLSGFRE